MFTRRSFTAGILSSPANFFEMFLAARTGATKMNSLAEPRKTHLQMPFQMGKRTHKGAIFGSMETNRTLREELPGEELLVG